MRYPTQAQARLSKRVHINKHPKATPSKNQVLVLLKVLQVLPVLEAVLQVLLQVLQGLLNPLVQVLHTSTTTSTTNNKTVEGGGNPVY